ncbi:hypothetical protein PPYR_10297 [Photinus pyralis]|uniref:Uncharacterized protein n=2 Tax=Photinus pyralis TaxID=7054 RepID=A0A1Y1LH09_PHOPY|nr:uncharacterized protein LOC116174067 [Photinus pyralis]KAB0796236.1 hypothetical protein PPYR_10297 [Photinus pyralis]
MKFLLIVIICAKYSSEMTTVWPITTSTGPCPGQDCSGGIWVDMGDPCWSCVIYDTCHSLGCDDPQSFCFLYNESFPMDQYAVQGECRTNPCAETPLLDEGGQLTAVCDGTRNCPTGYNCVESVCCKSL